MSSPGSPVTDPASNTAKLAEAATKTMDPPQVYIVDPETSSVDSYSLWDDEQGIMALRRYYALRDEAEDAITESQRTWLDTPFSVFATQCASLACARLFCIDNFASLRPSGMQAMLEYSLQNYGPLPSEFRLRRVRSRANSRPSPYPRTVETSFTSSPSMEHLRATISASLTTSTNNIAPRQPSPFSNALQQITINPNVPAMVSMESKGCITSPDKPKPVFGLSSRACVASGWSKRSTGRNGLENKENSMSVGNISIGVPAATNVSQGTMAT